MKNIFFDLDGTLIDSRKRLYLLFQTLVPESKFTFEEYWVLKRSKIGHEKILTEQFGYDEKNFSDFKTKWLDLIEKHEYLDKDMIYDHVLETLFTLSQKYILNVVSARQNKGNTVWQLKKYGLFDFFKEILITEHKRTKVDMLSGKTSPDDFIIGDTGYDILTGKRLNINTISVSYGFVSREKLMEYNPDILIDNFNELNRYL